MKRGWFSGMSCPKCSRLFSENELVKVLEGAGVSEKTIKKVREDIAKKQVSEELWFCKDDVLNRKESVLRNIREIEEQRQCEAIR